MSWTDSSLNLSGFDVQHLQMNSQRRKAVRGLEPAAGVVDYDEVGEMPFELGVIVVVIGFACGLGSL
jgi:hypothetical protein